MTCSGMMKVKTEARIYRTIPFEEMLLACGGFHHCVRFLQVNVHYKDAQLLLMVKKNLL